MTDPLYATLEAVKAAANINGTDSNAAILRLIRSSTGGLERGLGRRFYPLIETRVYDWPARGQGGTFINLDGDLHSVTTLSGDAQGTPVAIAAGDYFLDPANVGPPYNRISIDLSGNSNFSAGATYQRSVSVAGTWGFSADEATAGALAEAVDISETGVDVSDSSLIGIGDLIKVESERMVVTDKALITTGATLNGALDNGSDDVLVAVSDGTKVKRGEIITVDSERMLVEDIAANNLIVKRAYDGSTLASHLTAVIVYAPRTLTVVRASAGTTAATHADATAITVNVPPGKITSLVIAEVIAALAQEASSYSRNVGQGQGAASLDSAGLEALRKEVTTLYRRNRREAI